MTALHRPLGAFRDQAWGLIVFVIAALALAGIARTADAQGVCSSAAYTGHADKVRCDDFEDPALDGGTGWTAAYPTATPECPSAFDAGTGNWGAAEGPTGANCVDVVTESACGIAGQEDCVFGGNQAMASRLNTGHHGGFHGLFSLGGAHQTLSVTRARKYSHNFQYYAPALKDTEYGDSDSPIFGASTYNWWLSPPNDNANPPWAGGYLRDGTRVVPTVTVGVGTADPDTPIVRFAPDRSVYDFYNLHGVDRWECEQVSFEGIATANLRIRGWVNGRAAFDMTLDDSTTTKDTSGWTHGDFDSYYNTLPPYLMYRYQDEIVTLSSATPFPCTDIGFLDSDGDGVTDNGDNCVDTANVAGANGAQYDHDNDGYGNVCDGDFNNNGGLDFGDMLAIRDAQQNDPTNLLYDINDDGAVGLDDVGTWFDWWQSGPLAPGPSGFHP